MESHFGRVDGVDSEYKLSQYDIGAFWEQLEVEEARFAEVDEEDGWKVKELDEKTWNGQLEQC
eukprot:14142132-Ditylum_brightwellii.AAC.1